MPPLPGADCPRSIRAFAAWALSVWGTSVRPQLRWSLSVPANVPQAIPLPGEGNHRNPRDSAVCSASGGRSIRYGRRAAMGEVRQDFPLYIDFMLTPLPIRTFDDVASIGYRIKVYCDVCKQTVPFDPTYARLKSKRFTHVRFACSTARTLWTAHPPKRCTRIGSLSLERPRIWRPFPERSALVPDCSAGTAGRTGRSHKRGVTSSPGSPYGTQTALAMRAHDAATDSRLSGAAFPGCLSARATGPTTVRRCNAITACAAAATPGRPPTSHPRRS